MIFENSEINELNKVSLGTWRKMRKILIEGSDLSIRRLITGPKIRVFCYCTPNSILQNIFK